MALPPFSLLKTVRATFSAYGSADYFVSLTLKGHYRFEFHWRSSPFSLSTPAVLLPRLVSEVEPSLSSYSQSVVKMHTLLSLRSIAVSSSKSSSNVIVTNHHVEVCLFSGAGIILHPLFPPLQGNIRFFHRFSILTPFGASLISTTLKTMRSAFPSRQREIRTDSERFTSVVHPGKPCPLTAQCRW